MIRIAIKKSLNLFLTELFTDIMHKGVMNVVKIMNKIERINDSCIFIKNLVFINIEMKVKFLRIAVNLELKNYVFVVYCIFLYFNQS